MKYALGFLGAALLAVGCSNSSKPKAEADQAANGKPASDETKACITAYLGQCGWKDVELVRLDERADVPREAMIVSGEAWAYTFTANYTNLFGERQTSENWVAVLSRNEGKTCVRSCLDSQKKLVGGNSGAEGTDVAVLAPLPPSEGYPAIVAPKP